MDLSSLTVRWKESLDIFQRANLKLFVLAILNNFMRSGMLLVQRFWWLLVLWLAAAWISLAIGTSSYAFLVFLAPLPNFIIRTLILYVMIMTVRPSMEAKDYGYYWKYFTCLWAVVLLNLFYKESFFIPLLVPTLLFFLDSDQSPLSLINSVAKTLKMILFFLPVLTIITLVIALLNVPTYFFAHLTLDLGHAWAQSFTFTALLIVQDILLLLSLSVITVYYVKLKHSHFNLLFE
jgi:hypothetical protein